MLYYPVKLVRGSDNPTDKALGGDTSACSDGSVPSQPRPCPLQSTL